MEKDDINDLLSVLKNWKQDETDDKKTVEVLKRLQMEQIPDMESFKNINEVVVGFNKAICKASGVPAEIFEGKKKMMTVLKKKEEELKKKANKKPAELVKRKSVTIEYPANLTEGRPEKVHPIYKYIYKSFVSNFEEKEMLPIVVTFVHDLYEAVNDIFIEKGLLAEEKDKEIKNRLDKICQNLDRPTCAKAKV